MPQTYATYTEISAKALTFNPKSHEVIAKKQEIIRSISAHHNSHLDSVLFYGFCPTVLTGSFSNIYMTALSDTTKKLLESTGVKYTYINEDDLGQYKKQFNWVVATNEFFTFAESEEDQRASVELLVGLAKKVVVTTLKDYKNQDFRDREFSQPIAVRNGQDCKLFVEFHDYNYTDKNSWKTSVYELLGSNSNMFGPFNRRSMFFKQLAKFSIDAGARDFYVHKNLMYKSLIKKNYEHVISISL